MAATQQLSPSHNLFIATPNATHLYCQDSKKLLFECEHSDGIVNARPAKDNSGLIAVADSYLVILYDVAQGKDKKYKLKKADVSRKTIRL